MGNVFIFCCVYFFKYLGDWYQAQDINKWKKVDWKKIITFFSLIKFKVEIFYFLKYLGDWYQAESDVVKSVFIFCSVYLFKYLGDWYQAEGIPAFFQPSSTTCIRATYGDMGNK